MRSAEESRTASARTGGFWGLGAALLVAGTAAPAWAASVAVPQFVGPDRPAATAPRVVTALDRARFDGCAGITARVQTIAVPSGVSNRIVLHLTAETEGDPWDRLFSVSVGGVEVLRGTTPRVTFTVRKDITEYAALFPPGGQAAVRLDLGTYVGAWLGTVTLEFYSKEPTAPLVAAPWRRAQPIFFFSSLGGDGSTLTGSANFPATPPASAALDIWITNHGPDEAMFAGRVFHFLVDGREIATMRPMPYTYAIVGLGAANANTACSGPATTPEGQIVNGALWWTAQQVLDIGGIHVGPGEIPPYRAQVDAADLWLLTGARTVQIRQEGGASYWVTSLSVLSN